MANLIRNWATESISCNGKKKKIRFEDEWRRAEHSPDTSTERMLTLPSAPQPDSQLQTVSEKVSI